MALTYVVYQEANNGEAGIVGAASSTSRSYTAGNLVTVVYMDSSASAGTTYSISNTGTAQTWNPVKSVRSVTGTTDCGVAVWYCVMSTTESIVITAQTGADDVNAHLFVIVESGQHATTPIPAGNVFGNVGASDISQSITPTAAGSDLWLACADWNQTNSFGAASGCTLITGVNVDSQYTTCTVRPTTQPRTDANAFSIGETDSGRLAWVAWEVQAAAGGGGTDTPLAVTSTALQPVGQVVATAYNFLTGIIMRWKG